MFICSTTPILTLDHARIIGNTIEAHVKKISGPPVVVTVLQFSTWPRLIYQIVMDGAGRSNNLNTFERANNAFARGVSGNMVISTLDRLREFLADESLWANHTGVDHAKRGGGVSILLGRVVIGAVSVHGRVVGDYEIGRIHPGEIEDDEIARVGVQALTV